MRDAAGREAPNGLITVFGGSGFLGRHVVRALARAGWRVRVGVRRPDLAFHLQPLGWVGQIHAVQANVRYPASLAPALEDAEAAINLVGIGIERRRQTFKAVNEEGAAAVAAAVKAAGIPTFVHVGALGADAGSPSRYLRSKAAGEAAVRATFPEAVVARPAILFGPGDGFFTRLGRLISLGPVVPLFHPQTRLQPVFAGDAGEAVARAVGGAVAPGTTLELGGPEVLGFRECVEMAMAASGRSRALLPVPAGLAVLAGGVLQHLPGRLLGADHVRQLSRDSVVSPEAAAEGRTLEGLGLTPKTLELVLPTYMAQYGRGGRREA